VGLVSLPIPWCWSGVKKDEVTMMNIVSEDVACDYGMLPSHVRGNCFKVLQTFHPCSTRYTR
jgi:hypothetical protein